MADCPLCGYKYVCPCRSCNNRTPPAEDRTLPRWIWLEDDEEACPVCGLTLHLDQWLDIEWEQHKVREALSEKTK